MSASTDLVLILHCHHLLAQSHDPDQTAFDSDLSLSHSFLGFSSALRKTLLVLHGLQMDTEYSGMHPDSFLLGNKKWF